MNEGGLCVRQRPCFCTLGDPTMARMERNAMKVAVIGIGSNSVRMLLCEVTDGQIVRIRREREGTRLFSGLDREKRLSDEAKIGRAHV